MDYEKPWLSQIGRAFFRANTLKPVEGDEIDLIRTEIAGNVPNGKGSEIMYSTLVFRGWEGNYNGSIGIKYNTSHLETLFKNVTIPVIHTYNPHTLRELAAIFIEQYGLPYDVTWFEDGPFNAQTMPTHATLKTVRNSYCAPSTLTIRIERSESDITELFKNVVLEGLKMPFDPNMRSATIAMYGTDFTPFYDDQKALVSSLLVSANPYSGDVSNYEDPMGRLEIFNFLDVRLGDDSPLLNTDPNLDSMDKINLHRFYVRYHGPTVNAKYANVTANTAYERVVILESAAPTNLTNYDGPLFIHYNNA